MSEEGVETVRVPIAEGVMHVPEGPSEEAYLIGSRCSSCGEVHFPPRACCRRCSHMQLETVPLSRTGRLYSFTTVLVRLPGAKVDPPYHVGVVELPEGERLRTLVAPEAEQPLSIGAEMELVFDVVYSDEQGRDVVGWKFAPVSRGKA